jgi:endo-1,4-beta-xylanase
MAQTLPTMPPTNYEQVGVYPAGAVNTITYYSSVYGANEQMMVYTPPNYDPGKKYGAIYGYQGISTGIDTIFDDWCVDAGNIEDNLLGGGIIKQPVIIVAVNDQINGDPTADTINCAIPYIDSHYSTYADADHRGLYGYSWGGMYAADTGCANLNTFHYISPSSPAFFSSGQGPNLFPNGGAQAKQVLKCFLLSCGTADWDGFYPASLDLATWCQANGIPNFYWLPVQGEGHDAGVWAPAMWNFLQLADAAGISGPVTVSAYSQIEAESYGAQTGGIQIETCGEGGQDITNIQYGSFVVYSNVDFGTGAASFQARVASAASGGNIELHLDSLTGVQMGTCAVPNTGGWQTWVTQSCPVGGAAGIHNLYLKFTGGSNNLLNLNWLRFNPTAGVDIGSVGVAGTASCSNSVFTVVGAGADIQGTADAFHFVYVTASGDCTMVARVTSVPNINSWAKAGVMIRESLNPGAANAFIAVTPGNGVTWQYRSSTNGATTYNNTNGLNAPYWVAFRRSGNTFTAYRSPDGKNWTQQGSATFTMASTAYIGLAVTSHNSSSLCMATFDNVSAPGWFAALAPAPAGLVAAAASSAQINLTWNACTNATSYNVKRSTTSGGPYANIATGVTTTNYTDAGASVRAGYYYVVSAMVGGTETPNSAEAVLNFPKLTGSIIGTPGSWGNSGNTITNVFDNNLTTFFDAPTGNGDWVGLDFGVGVSNVIAQINYTPRSGFESRMTNGIFQGANRADFSDTVTLCIVTAQPATGVFTSVSVTNTTAFRYVLYLSPNGGFGNVAELQFYGYPLSAPAPVPGGLSATAISTSQINLVWNIFSNTATYNLKRSTTNGGPYSVIATGVITTNYPDSGLASGMIYYYVVSAVVSGNETPNSVQAAATTLSPTLGSLLHRYSFSESGGSSVADSVGGPVWNGSLSNGGTLSGGQLTLSANASQYVSLPAGIVGGLSNLTVMAWVNPTTVSNWSRLFDFGNSTTVAMYVTAQNATTTNLYFAITTNSYTAEQPVYGNFPLSTGVWHQVTLTLNGSTGMLYLDGAAVGTTNALTLNPVILGSTTNNYLGKSQWTTDPYYNGQFDEFRIYNAALSPAEVAATYALGPGQLLSTNSPVVGIVTTPSDLTLTWPLVSASFTLQSSTNLAAGNWVNVTSPAPQIAGTNYQIVLPATNPAQFFRMAK